MTSWSLLVRLVGAKEGELCYMRSFTARYGVFGKPEMIERLAIILRLLPGSQTRYCLLRFLGLSIGVIWATVFGPFGVFRLLAALSTPGRVYLSIEHLSKEGRGPGNLRTDAPVLFMFMVQLGCPAPKIDQSIELGRDAEKAIAKLRIGEGIAVILITGFESIKEAMILIGSMLGPRVLCQEKREYKALDLRDCGCLSNEKDVADDSHRSKAAN
ncbi:hypothetical protein LXL04_027296 [Taraxacum kok-saghyz]